MYDLKWKHNTAHITQRYSPGNSFCQNKSLGCHCLDWILSCPPWSLLCEGELFFDHPLNHTRVCSYAVCINLRKFMEFQDIQYSNHLSTQLHSQFAPTILVLKTLVGLWPWKKKQVQNMGCKKQGAKTGSLLLKRRRGQAA